MRVNDTEAAQRVAEHENLVGELVEALKDSIAALEIYKAYGWSDRKGVLTKSRDALAKAEKQGATA